MNPYVLVISLNLWILTFVGFVAVSTYIFPSEIFGVVVGVVSWLVLFYKTFENFFVETEANEGLVLYDPFLKTQREVHDGLNMKLLHEEVYKKISTRGIELESKEDESYPCLNGPMLTPTWTIVVVPRKGSYVQIASLPDGAIEKFVRGVVAKFLNSYISARNDEDIYGTPPKEHFIALCDSFARLFEGQNGVELADLGYEVRKSQLSDIDRDALTQQGQQAQTLTESVAKAARKLVEDSRGTLKWADALVTVQIETGKRTGETFDFRVSGAEGWNNINLGALLENRTKKPTK